MFTEEDLLPLSAIQHLLFCERQCALIHVERLWVENRYTAEGRVMHERVHTTNKEARGCVRIAYAVPLKSLQLGLAGQADVVEFHKKVRQDGSSQPWQPFPVEYKRGRAKQAKWDQVQLCAQAMCLEEMLKVEILDGALFYGKTRRRQAVHFDEVLRAMTTNASQRLHGLVASGRTPKPVYSSKCESCSFIDTCLPKTTGRPKSVLNYLQKIVQER
jgi:CRISPR-associated exonuclease Cas4